MNPIAHKKTITGPIVQAPNHIASKNDIPIAFIFVINLITPYILLAYIQKPFSLMFLKTG